MIQFDWDENKAKLNLQKHGVSFEEATTVFFDDQIRVFTDEIHSNADEERLIAIGYSNNNRILTVVHCYRDQDGIIRIISARKATTQEKKFFQRKR